MQVFDDYQIVCLLEVYRLGYYNQNEALYSNLKKENNFRDSLLSKKKKMFLAKKEATFTTFLCKELHKHGWNLFWEELERMQDHYNECNEPQGKDVVEQIIYELICKLLFSISRGLIYELI